MSSTGLVYRQVEGGLPPPPGVTPDFEHPDTLAKYNIMTHTLCLSLVTIFVVMRMYTRIRISRSVGWDDYMCVFAYLWAAAYSILALARINIGTGVHMWNVPKPVVVRWLRHENVQQTIYAPTICFVKLCILLFYNRIFSSKFTMKILIRLMIGFLSAFYLANMVCKIFLCTPRSKIWNRTQEGHCLDQNAIFWVTSIVNVVTDFYILVLPLPLIWNLQLRAQKKIGLTLVFMLGLFACITSILRLAKTIEVDDNPDVTFAFNALTLWTVAEIDVGLICACLPALPPFLYHFFPKLSTTIASKIVGSSNPVDTSRSDGPPPMSKTGTVLPASYVDCGDPRLATGKFVEVGDGGAVRDVEGSGGQIGSNTVVVGGARDDWEKDLQDPRMEGIMKTVDLEQS